MSKKKKSGRPVSGPLVAVEEAPTHRWTPDREAADAISDDLLRKVPAQLTEDEISLLSLALSGVHGNEIMARRKRLQ